MLLRIFLVLLIICTPITVRSAEHDSNQCNIDSTYLEIYSRAIRQAFEIMVSAKKIAKNDVQQMTLVESNQIISILNKEFDTKIFSKACFTTGKLYTFTYATPSFMRFSIYQTTFSNNEDMKYVQNILGNVKRDYFRTNKSPTNFTWHKGGNSIFIIMETILIGHERLEQLK
jgi:hypothetical protein